MKRSKRKRGSSSSSKISAKAKPQRKPIELRFPPTEDWKNIVSDYKLMPAQADTLKFTLEEALYGIRRYQAKLKKQPSRSRLIDDLKRFEKALGLLRDECGRTIDLMHDFLPTEALAYIGQSMTFSAIGEALGRGVFPKNLDFKIRAKQSQGEQITFASVEHLSRPRRETLGLEYGHLLLKHFIEQIHQPLARWIEMKSLDEGGRPADAVRNYLIYQLAEVAPEVIGKRASIATTGKFVDLCTLVLGACGLPETGVGKAIPAVVKKLRADQKKQANFHIA
jgi:hypothetical protein